jgi:hypothetical protein
VPVPVGRFHGCAACAWRGWHVNSPAPLGGLSSDSGCRLVHLHFFGPCLFLCCDDGLVPMVWSANFLVPGSEQVGSVIAGLVFGHT